LHERRFHKEPGLAAAGTADYKDIFISCVFRLLRAAVHGEPFRICEKILLVPYRFNKRPKQGGGNRSLTIPPPCLLSLHILFSVELLFPLFLPQDTVNALSDFLGFGQRFLPLILEIGRFLLSRFSQPRSTKPPCPHQRN